MVVLNTQAAETLDSDVAPPKHKKSAGEVAFNRIVYTGIGFFLNEAMSLWITDQFLHGKNLLARIPGLQKAGMWFSREGFSRASGFIAKTFKLTEKTAKDGSRISPEARGGNALLMVTLLSGGTLLLLPMKWLEHHKIQLIEKANHILDRMRSTKLTPEEAAARDAEERQHIACSPRQSLPSLLIGRLLAVSSSVATGTFLMGPERNNKLMDWSEKLFTGSVQTGEKSTLRRYLRLGIIETYSCTISSVVLEIMSKLFARHRYLPHDPDICKDAAATTAAKPASGEDNKEEDCGCAGRYSAKIQSQKDQAAAKPQAIQV